MFFRFATLLLCTAAILPGARAQTPEYTSCLSRAGSSTVQQGMCAQAELTRQDQRLNRVYQALMTRYQPAQFAEQHAKLREEERVWIARRDNECKLNGDTVDNVCLVQRTVQRAEELEARLKQ
jgi:uncharacterized protein YecT (DUF1311 family)